MRSAGRLLGGAGVVVAALGVFLLARPGLAAAVSTRRLVVSLVAVVAFLQAARVVKTRWDAEFESATVPTVDSVRDGPTPGAAFERALAETGAGVEAASARDAVRDELAGTAVDALVRRENCRVAAARDRIESGTWTDDEYAAAFLRGETPDPPLSVRLRLLAGGESSFGWLARRTADAVYDIHTEGGAP